MVIPAFLSTAYKLPKLLVYEDTRHLTSLKQTALQARPTYDVSSTDIDAPCLKLGYIVDV